jgi:hypothetical protein
MGGPGRHPSPPAPLRRPWQWEYPRRGDRRQGRPPAEPGRPGPRSSGSAAIPGWPGTQAMTGPAIPEGTGAERAGIRGRASRPDGRWRPAAWWDSRARPGHRRSRGSPGHPGNQARYRPPTRRPGRSGLPFPRHDRGRRGQAGSQAVRWGRGNQAGHRPDNQGRARPGSPAARNRPDGQALRAARVARSPFRRVGSRFPAYPELAAIEHCWLPSLARAALRGVGPYHRSGNHSPALFHVKQPL